MLLGRGGVRAHQVFNLAPFPSLRHSKGMYNSNFLSLMIEDSIQIKEEEKDKKDKILKGFLSSFFFGTCST